MINLISPMAKQNIRAARDNVILRRYVIGLFIAVAAAAALFGVGYYLTLQSNTSMRAEKEAADQRIAGHLDADADAKRIAEKMSGAQAIFDREVAFSEVIIGIAQALPEGTRAKSLSLSAADFGKPVSFDILATSREQAEKVKDALNESPVLSNVSVNGIGMAPGASQGGDTTGTTYPISATVTATFSKPAATLGGQR